MKLIDTLEEFIKSRKMSGLVNKSIDNYRDFCTMFLKQIGIDMEYDSLSQEHIEKYVLSLMNRPISKTTIATYIRHMKIYLKWCSENYKNCKYDYKKIKVPKSPKKNVRIYTDEEIRELYICIDNSIDWIKIRNKAIISLMFDSGLRQAEITRIKTKDIDYKRNTINVHGKGAKDRLVPLGNVSARYIRQYVLMSPKHLKEDDIIFISRDMESITTNTIKLMITSLEKKLSFDLTSHKLRHNFATNWCLNQYKKYGQIDIYQLMYLLGHEDIETTKRYLHMAYEYIATEKSISHLDNVFKI